MVDLFVWLLITVGVNALVTLSLLNYIGAQVTLKPCVYRNGYSSLGIL